MKINSFKLELYFAKYEFTAPYLLCCSDCEPLSMKELLEMGDSGTLDLWNRLSLGYTETRGHPKLREEITKLYRTINSDDLLVLTPEEGIFVAINVILEGNDHVITTYPSFQSLYEIANSIGCEVDKWIPEYNDGWHFNIDTLERLVKKNTKLIIINFPHNPTAALPNKDEFQRFIDIAKKNNIYVFSDEMYRLLEYDEDIRLDSACDIYENAVTLSGLSKSFSLGGVRIGWLATKNRRLLNEFDEFKAYTTISCSAPSEILAMIAIKNWRKITERNKKIIANNLDLLDKFFDKYSNVFSWVRPVAGPIAFPAINKTIDVSAFCQKLVDEKGVLLLPPSVYDFPHNNIRFGFGRTTMPKSLEKLDEFMRENY